EFTSDGVGQWTFDADGSTGTAPSGKPSWIIHDSGVADVRVSFDVDPAALGADGAALVRIDGGRRRVELEARRDDMTLVVPGPPGSEADEGGPRFPLDVGGLGSSKSRLGFAVADRVVRVYRDGRLVA